MLMCTFDILSMWPSESNFDDSFSKMFRKFAFFKRFMIMMIDHLCCELLLPELSPAEQALMHRNVFQVSKQNCPVKILAC